MFEGDLRNLVDSLKTKFEDRLADDKIQPAPRPMSESERLLDDIRERHESLAESVSVTAATSDLEVGRAIAVLSDWMISRENVRVIGAGRAKLAGAIPANRLAHGGARVSIVDDLVPMPHTYRAGGIIAVSASGTTPQVLDALRAARSQDDEITVIGLARQEAAEFAGLCDVFIGIRVEDRPDLSALADIEEYAISLLLDSLVVAAGRRAGFDDTTWRLGHENLGPTGHYDDTLGRLPRTAGETMGRGELRDRLLHSIRDPESDFVLCLSGPMGVGKRTLAQRIAMELEPAHLVLSSAAWVSWLECLADAVEQLEDGVARPKAARERSASEIIDAILRYAETSNAALVIDGVSGDEPGLVEFVRRWSDADTAGRSQLILTTDEDATTIENVPGVRVEPVRGLDDEMARKVVGGVLPDGPDLRGNPQLLHYVSHVRQECPERIEECLLHLGRSLRDPVDLSPIRHGRERIALVPLLALSRLRDCEFDEALLGHLWDSFDQGGARAYGEARRLLLDTGILKPASGSELQLDPLVQAELRKALDTPLVKGAPKQADHFIGQYFRTRFTEAHAEGVSAEALKALELYAYHSLRYGKVEVVHDYIVRSSLLEEAFQQGLADALQPILEHLECAIEAERERVLGRVSSTQASSEAKRKLLTRADQLAYMLAEVRTELGRVCKDQGTHTQGLEHLNEALTSLESLSRDSKIRDLQKRIHHYRGIACSDTGATRECLEAYSAAVAIALDDETLTPQDALSLGYLAYELKFHDFELAEEMGKLAVKVAQALKDPVIEIKNLCSLGVIYAFSPQDQVQDGTAKGKEVLDLAFKLHDANSAGEREVRRLLLNRSVLLIRNAELDEAEEDLARALAPASEPLTSDRRRAGMAKSYRGIIAWRNGDTAGGAALVAEALAEHKEVEAIRERIYEARTLETMDSELYDASSLDDIPSDRREVFLRFFDKCYGPALLGSK